MNVTLPFSFLDEKVRNMNGLTEIVPLRVRADLTALSKTEKKNLKEFANIENGISERILLVPDVITIGALEGVIDKSFGLISDMFNTMTVFAEKDMAKLFPSLYSLIEYAGLILEDPFNDEMAFTYRELQARNDFGIVPGPFYPSPKSRYPELRDSLCKLYKKELKEGVMYNGVMTSLKDIPATAENIEKYLDRKDMEFIVSLSLNLHLFEALAPKGAKTYNAEAFRKNAKKAEMQTTTNNKPLAHSFDSLRYNDSGELAFTFHVDMPKDISFIIEDGYLSIEDYIDSVEYVSNTFLPDCIYKSGYDLFGKDTKEYYDFIMSLHSGGIPLALHDLMAFAGWREPFLDVRKVLRY